MTKTNLEIEEAIWEVAQIARERVKDEAFEKTENGGHSLNLTQTRQIIYDAIKQILQQRMDEIGSRVGILRQLLNEDHIDDPKKMIDNEYILGVLNIIKSVDKNK
jgi:hypothetical protein